MSWFYLEERTVSKSRLLIDLIHHLQRRCMVGDVVIVVDKPDQQLAVMRKEWIRGEYQVERQAASTLGERRELLSTENQRLQTIRFKSATASTKAQVLLAAPSEPTHLPEGYATLYILSDVTDGQRTSFVSQLRRGGLIVVYSVKK